MTYPFGKMEYLALRVYTGSSFRADEIAKRSNRVEDSLIQSGMVSGESKDPSTSREMTEV